MTINKNNPVPIVAVNGLTRGGTNLISSLLQAQNDVVCSDIGIFELTTIMQYIATSDFQPMINSGELNKINNNFDKYIDVTVKYGSNILIPSMRQFQEKYRISRTHYCGISIAEWINYYTSFYRTKSMEDFEASYQFFAQSHNLKVMATRVTGSTPYINPFLSQCKSRYWIEIIRDPLARFYSAKKGHSLLPEYSFKQSRWQLDLLDTVTNSNLIIISYEELTNEPYKVIDDILTRIGINDYKINITPVTPDGEPFYGNSSNNETIFSQNIDKHPSIYKTSIAAYKGNLTTYENYVAKYYGFNGSLNWIAKLPFLFVKAANHVINLLTIVCVFLAISIKFTAVALSLSRYFAHSGYHFNKSLRRAFSDLVMKYSEWKF